MRALLQAIHRQMMSVSFRHSSSLTLSGCKHLSVMHLSSTLFLLLDLVELVLVLPGISRQHLCDDGLLLLFASETVVRPICSASDDGSNLTIFGNKALLPVFFEELLAHGNNVSHLQGLKVSLELRGQVRPGKRIPVTESILSLTSQLANQPRE